MQAMILAAGFGTRLHPYTQYRPKPLFPVLNKPLLQCTIEMLRRYGAETVVVNCHHLGEQIVKAVADIEGVIVQQEEIILGTGGGVRRARKNLTDEPLLLTNGDIYHSIDLAQLYQAHLRSGMAVTLAMHDYPRFNTVDVRGNEICGFGTGEINCTKKAFTGIHVINPEVLDRIVDQEYSCIIDLYRSLLKDQIKINVYDTTGCFWTDMGTVADYLALNRDILAQEAYRLPELGISQKENQHRGSNVFVDSSASIEGWAVLGDNVQVGLNASLKNVVVWDNVVIPENAVFSDTIITG